MIGALAAGGLDNIDPRIGIPAAVVLWLVWLGMVWRDRRADR